MRAYDQLDRLVRTLHGGGVEERFFFDRNLTAEALGEPPTENSLGRLVRAERQTPTGTYMETFRYESKPGTGDPLDNRALLERVTQTGPEHSFESRYEYYDRSARIMVQHYPQTDFSNPFAVLYCYDAQGTMTIAFDAHTGFNCGLPNIGTANYRRTSVKDGMVEDAYRLGNGVEIDLELDADTYRLRGHSITGNNLTVGFQYDYEPGGRLSTEHVVVATNTEMILPTWIETSRVGGFTRAPSMPRPPEQLQPLAAAERAKPPAA